jgi:K+-sensing histidine kinase KdpD
MTGIGYNWAQFVPIKRRAAVSIESSTVERTKLQRLQRTLLVIAALAIVLGELTSVFVQHKAVLIAVFDGLITLAIATALIFFSFRIVYQLLTIEERRLRESRILLDIATGVSSTLDLTQLLKLIARHTAEACQVHRCSILLWDEGRHRIQPLMSQYASGSKDAQLWDRFRSNTYLETLQDVHVLRQIFEEKQPMVLDQVGISSLPESWTKPFGVAALLLVPLVSRGRAIGLMALDRTEPRGFGQDQINLAMTIASQAATAVEHAGLFEQLNEKARRLALLSEISMAVTSTLDLDAILNTAAAGLCRAFQVQQCEIIIFDEERLNGRLVAEHPRRGEMLSLTIPLRDNPCIERIMSTKQALAIEDAQHDPQLANLCETMRQRNVQSVLIVPLLVKGAVVGTIDLDVTEGKRVFTTEETGLAQTIANQISVAMDNARLYQQRMDDISALREIDQLKSNLVSNVSHELRAPLTSIKAYTELLLAEAESANNETCRDWLAVIDRETERLTSLITDYLNLSRLESGRFRLAEEPLQLTAVVAEVVATLEVQAKRRHITVQVDAQPGLPELWADGDLIRVVVRNLVSNAIKFSDDGGHICITIWHQDNTFKFSVQDEGPGIPEEALPNLFDKFFRVPTANDVPGTGLGLALAKEAVMAHGGRIDAESTVGKGSRFTVSIPAQSRAMPQQDQQARA